MDPGLDLCVKPIYGVLIFKLNVISRHSPIMIQIRKHERSFQMEMPKIYLPLGTLKKISVADVLSDSNSRQYLMSFGFDLDELKTSIATVGIINPPILRQNEGGKIEIVTGYRRLRAASELHIEQVTSRVFLHNELAPDQALLVALYENLSIRTFNIIEKALVLRNLSRFYGKEEIIRTYMPLLGLPKRDEVYRQYLEMEKTLSEPIKEALANGKIQMKTAEILLEVDDNSREIISHFGSALNLNINQWHQFVDLTVDLMNIENRPASEVLEEIDINLLKPASTISNLPQQANAVLNFLKSKRHPRATAFQKQIRKKLGKMKLPEGARIVFPYYAEEPEYRLEVSFKDGPSLRERLLKIANDPMLHSIRLPLIEAISVGQTGEIPGK
ncbi:MAG TPA: hypothetical protein ENF92_08870 [Desulfobacteraceae bacterium]|nr:hypothetical protein [Desulfobacteraceae bacterium]